MVPSVYVFHPVILPPQACMGIIKRAVAVFKLVLHLPKQPSETTTPTNARHNAPELASTAILTTLSVNVSFLAQLIL